MAKKQSAVTDEHIIAALMSSGTIGEAAAALDISPRTIYDRMSNAAFKAAYQAAKSDLIRQATFTLNGKVAAAINTISDIMSDKNEKPTVRLHAAELILTHAGQFALRLKGEENIIAAEQIESKWE